MRVMVGNYKSDDENYADANYWGGGGHWSEMPLENDYSGIRRAFWLNTDALYKSAAETYERKQSAKKQQNLTPEEDTLSDFSKAKAVKLTLPYIKVINDKEQWESRAKELSGIFKNYPDIYASNVFLCFYHADVFYTNTEGTETIYPVLISGLLINAYTQAEDGKPLFDHLIYYGLTSDDMPKQEVIKKDIEGMISNLEALRKAPLFNDSYSGPILFEGQAAGELVSQRLFASSSGLIAERTPLYSDPSASMYMSKSAQKSIEDKIGRKIIANDITIKATPKVQSFEGTNLIGKFEIDAEGVQPQVRADNC